VAVAAAIAKICGAGIRLRSRRVRRQMLCSACRLLFQQALVIGMMANPNPDHQVAFSMCHSAIVDTDSGRIEARVSFQTLEMKRTVIRIRQPKPITLVS